MVSDTATLDTLLETTDDPIVVLGTADTIVDCNAPARVLVTVDDEWTGLGLAIVKRFVDGHGWTVTVTDSETGGARFEVWTDGRPGASKSGADTDISGS